MQSQPSDNHCTHLKQYSNSMAIFAEYYVLCSTRFRSMNGQKVEGRLFSMERGKGGVSI